MKFFQNLNKKRILHKFLKNFQSLEDIEIIEEEKILKVIIDWYYTY